MVRASAVVLLALFLPQDKPIEVRVKLASGDEVAGALKGVDAEGTLQLEVAGAVQSVRHDGVVSVTIVDDVPAPEAKKDVLRFAPAGSGGRVRQAGLVAGKLISLAGDVFTIEGDFGALKIPRGLVRDVRFGVEQSKTGVEEDRATDVVDTVDGAVKGTVASIDADSVTVREAAGERKIERAKARLILLAEPAEPPQASAGLFYRLQLKGGDDVPCVLRGFDGVALKVFCHAFGEATVPLERVAKLTTIHRTTFMLGRLVMASYQGVYEEEILPTPNKQGMYETKKVWSYQRQADVQQAQSITRLENGNLVVVNQYQGRVVIVAPKPSDKGETVWKRDGLSQPMDAQRLPNGNVLIVEMGTRKVSEYKAEGDALWEFATEDGSQPQAARRLPNGNTIVLTTQKIVELGPEKDVVRTIPLGDNIYGQKMEILDNGNFLVVSGNYGLVREVDGDGKTVWEKKGLSQPVGAVRLDNGNTLVAEQHNQYSITEWDSAGKAVRKIRPRQQYLTGITVY